MSSNHPPPSHAARLRSERGASLIFALFGLVTLTILGVGLTSLGMMATTMASNERDTQDALALADAGLSHAKKMILFQEWPWDNMTPLLTSGDGQACNGDELAQPPPGAPGHYPTLFITAAAAGGQPLGTGTYRVYVCDDHVTDEDEGVLNLDPHVDVNKRILVRSVGTTATGATATVEQIFESGTTPALLVNGNLSVRGDVEVGGGSGIIHANGEMDIVGNSVCAHEYFSSTETITGGIPEGGENCDGGDGELRPGSAPVNIRLLSPTDFKPLAQYWLTTTTSGGGGGGKGGGGAVSVTGLVKRNPNYPAPAAENEWVIEGTTLTGWSFAENDFSWKSNGGLPETVYYLETNVSLGGSIGSQAAPAQLTILAEGWVDIAGAAKIEAKLGATTPIPRIGKIAVVSGRDIELSGNPGATKEEEENAFTGLFYARHQVEIGGTPAITGQVMALNEDDTPFPTVEPNNQVKATNRVTLEDGFMKISGNPKITYSGGGLEGVTGRFWRECRYNADNQNPLDTKDACGPQWGGT